MGTLKITKKHHRHINNPFPSTPRSLPFIQGPLFFNSKTLPSHDKILPIGNDFQLLWSSNNGGYLSISHLSQPTRPIWSTIPGQAFVSAALAKTEIEESRGSFVFKDRDVHSVCDHQTIEDIRVINQIDSLFYDKDLDSSSGHLGLDQKTDLKDTQFPALLVTGWIFSNKKKRRLQSCGIYKNKQFSIKANPVSASVRYCLLFDQKTSNQIRFRLKLCEQTSSYFNPNGLSRNHHPCRKLRLRRKIKLGYDWCGFFTRARGFLKISSSEDEIGAAESKELKINRVFLTYSSEENERFYGFGEQFSHMDFKGKRVPIFVQEQGIGRGDQPITFAANLVSYRCIT